VAQAPVPNPQFYFNLISSVDCISNTTPPFPPLQSPCASNGTVKWTFNGVLRVKQHSMTILGTESQDLAGKTWATTLQASSRSSVTKPSSQGESGTQTVRPERKVPATGETRVTCWLPHSATPRSSPPKRATGCSPRRLCSARYCQQRAQPFFKYSYFCLFISAIFLMQYIILFYDYRTTFFLPYVIMYSCRTVFYQFKCNKFICV
jgi:hypothetical protein